MQAFRRRATARGYEDVLADPAAGADALLEANPAIDPEFAHAVAATRTCRYLTAGGRPFGSLDPASIAQMSGFMVDAGLIDAPIPPRRYADFSFADGGGDG